MATRFSYGWSGDSSRQSPTTGRQRSTLGGVAVERVQETKPTIRVLAGAAAAVRYASDRSCLPERGDRAELKLKAGTVTRHLGAYAPVVPIVTVQVIVSVSPACLSMFEYTARASIVPTEAALKMPASRSAALVPSPAAQVPT